MYFDRTGKEVNTKELAKTSFIRSDHSDDPILTKRVRDLMTKGKHILNTKEYRLETI